MKRAVQAVQTTMEFFTETPQTYFCHKCGECHRAGECEKEEVSGDG